MKSIASLSFVLLNVKSVEREKLKNFEYHEKEKSFLDEIKSIFYSFWRISIFKKKKKKKSRHKLSTKMVAVKNLSLKYEKLLQVHF